MDNEIPRIRVREEEQKKIMTLYASDNAIQKLFEDDFLLKRIKSVPNLYRDLRLVQRVLSDCTDKLLDTIPLQKLAFFKREMRMSDYYVTHKKPTFKYTDAKYELLNNRQYNALVTAAWEGNCSCCDKDCNRCELGKAFDELIKKDRDGSSWFYHDVRRELEE